MGMLLGWSMYDMSLQKPRAQLLGEEWYRVSDKSCVLPLISYVALGIPHRHPETARKLAVCLSMAQTACA